MAEVRDGKVSSGEIRQDFIHSHGIALHALGHVGNYLLRNFPRTGRAKLKGLQKLDWRRSNAALWEGRAMVGGRLLESDSKCHAGVWRDQTFAALTIGARRGQTGACIEEI